MDRQYEPWFLWLTLDEIVWLLYDVRDDRYAEQLEFYRRAASRRAEAWEEEERYWARKQRRPARSASELTGVPQVSLPTGLRIQPGMPTRTLGPSPLRQITLPTGLRIEPGLTMQRLEPTRHVVGSAVFRGGVAVKRVPTGYVRSIK